MEIIQVKKSFQIEDKRFYSGYEFRDDCPKCNTKVIKNAEHYLRYPQVGKPISISFYCEHCGCEWNRKIEITIKVEYVPDETYCPICGSKLSTEYLHYCSTCGRSLISE